MGIRNVQICMCIHLHKAGSMYQQEAHPKLPQRGQMRDGIFSVFCLGPPLAFGAWRDAVHIFSHFCAFFVHFLWIYPKLCILAHFWSFFFLFFTTSPIFAFLAHFCNFAIFWFFKFHFPHVPIHFLDVYWVNFASWIFLWIFPKFPKMCIFALFLRPCWHIPPPGPKAGQGRTGALTGSKGPKQLFFDIIGWMGNAQGCQISAFSNEVDPFFFCQTRFFFRHLSCVFFECLGTAGQFFFKFWTLGAS